MSTPTKKTHLKPKTRERLSVTLLLSPFLVLFVLFTVLPIIGTLVLSFLHFDLLAAPQWAGFQNFQHLFFQNERFSDAFFTTVLLAAVTAPLCFFAAVAVAFVLARINRRVAKVLLLLFSLPMLAGGLFGVAEYVFGDSIHGLLNSRLIYLNIIDSPIDFGSNQYALVITFLLELLFAFGIGFIAIYSGFRSIPQEYKDVFVLESGKNVYFELVNIYLPFCKRQILFAAIVEVGAAFTMGSSQKALPTISLYAEEKFLALQLGQSAAATLTLCLLATVTYFAVRRAFRKTV